MTRGLRKFRDEFLEADLFWKSLARPHAEEVWVALSR
jgi:hypothetical protein